ncbi:hypothetical protein HMPREF9194_01476 [Treponema maltophilum ATCC 51939]|uniref:Maltose/galactoside acetyltransferase domain-containing protein n=1 Tax=Treponema maltophilum ATCC 51939 TaxID=1125699 RepID=S3L304_TREMA|nr:hypothetical protein [Treponema maltophilum]EPF31139.1 hypothetical protein HMPREF9194_01476 [Treponema maltophilum ATCC 51939]
MPISLKRFLVNKLSDLLPSSCFAYRRFILRFAGVHIAKTAKINEGFRVYGRGNVDIGDNAWIGKNCTLYTMPGCTVAFGKNCDIGPETCFNCQSHKTGTPEHRAGTCSAHDIKIGSGVWIGMRSTVLCSQIGSGAVIGAASLVLKDVPPNVLCAGNPAEIKKTLPFS